MAITKEFLFEEMREHNYPFWKIMSGKGQSVMAKCNPDVTDVDAQIAMLNSRLSKIKLQPYADVIITNRLNKEFQEEGNKKELQRLTVLLDNDDESDDGSSGSAIGFNPAIYHSMNDANSKALEKLQEERHKLEISKLEFAKDKEIAALKDEFAKLREELLKEDDDDDDSMGALEQVKPYIPQIMAMLGIKLPMQTTPRPTTMAGTYKTDTNVETKVTVEDEIDPELQKQEIKAAKASSQLLRIDPNAGDALLMLAEFATLSPDSYFGFLPLLQSQLEMIKNKK